MGTTSLWQQIYLANQMESNALANKSEIYVIIPSNEHINDSEGTTLAGVVRPCSRTPQMVHSRAQGEAACSGTGSILSRSCGLMA